MRGFRIREIHREVERFGINDSQRRQDVEASNKAQNISIEEMRKVEETKNFWDNLLNSNFAN